MTTVGFFVIVLTAAALIDGTLGMPTLDKKEKLNADVLKKSNKNRKFTDDGYNGIPFPDRWMEKKDSSDDHDSLVDGGYHDIPWLKRKRSRSNWSSRYKIVPYYRGSSFYNRGIRQKFVHPSVANTAHRGKARRYRRSSDSFSQSGRNQKRFPMVRKATDEFSPWGKRAVNDEFSPWGKRDLSSIERKASDDFSPWGKKRSNKAPRAVDEFSPWGKKRSAGAGSKSRKAADEFSPWGKRYGADNFRMMKPYDIQTYPYDYIM